MENAVSSSTENGNARDIDNVGWTGFRGTNGKLSGGVKRTGDKCEETKFTGRLSQFHDEFTWVWSSEFNKQLELLDQENGCVANWGKLKSRIRRADSCIKLASSDSEVTLVTSNTTNFN